MRVIFIFFLLFWGVLEGKIHVLVSIAPQKYVVESIGGDKVTVDVMVPPGANSHTYEPTPKQILAARQGEVWFRIGESFEQRLIAVLDQTEIIDQREGLDLIHAGCGCCTHEAHDPHIWLSPRLLKIQATQIANVLCKKDPQNEPFFKHHLSLLQQELSRIDDICTNLLSVSPQRLILVSHPAFGYFCRDYGLEQLSIEMEGREPTPRYLIELIATARSQGVKMVFLQIQHNPKGGKKIAQELGIPTQYIDPYAENVIENILTIARLFSNA
jgi:zinc transport system substrate-binding protein